MPADFANPLPVVPVAGSGDVLFLPRIVRFVHRPEAVLIKHSARNWNCLRLMNNIRRLGDVMRFCLSLCD
jgi:hypothetical protein